MVVMIKFSMSQFLALKVAARAFIFKLESPQELITTIVNLANIARKEACTCAGERGDRKRIPQRRRQNADRRQ